MFPDQRSTSDQLEDVASWAEEEGLGNAAAWVRGKADKPSPDDYKRLCEIAVHHRCYDAHDALCNTFREEP